MNRSSTSPFRGATSTNPRTGSGYESAELLIRNLEQENNSLVQEINVLKTKGKKMNELEDKIDMILRHNTQLLNENERLAKLINQKKSQVEIWKNKHDSAMANRSSASEVEMKRLLNEIEKLKEEGCEIEHAKNLQINEIKNQFNSEIQAMKRNNLSNAEKYELEIRKLKEYCDKKDYEASDLKMKIARHGKQTDFEIGKLREEKERLRSDLQFEEAEHRKEIDSLKSKFDYNFHSEIENLKKQHLNQIQTLDYENSKLKEVVNSKNIELEQAILKQNKMRNHFEDSLDILKKENIQLKEKLVENQHIADLELNNLRQKLESIKQSQIALLNDAHTNQIDILNREISKLHRFLDSRNEEIENISKERSQMRQSLESEVLKLKAALYAQENEARQVRLNHEEALRVCDEDFKYKNEEMRTMESFLKNQVQAFRQQKQNSDNLLRSRDAECERILLSSREQLSNLEEQLRVVKQTQNQTKDELERTQRRSSSESQDLKKIHDLKTRQFQSKIISLEDECKENQGMIAELRENINLLQKELKLTEEKVQYLQNTEKQLRSQGRENFNRWDAKEKQLNRLIRSQIESMERTKGNQVEELKSIHDNKTRSLKHQIKELEKQIEDKNRLLNSQKSKYEQLVNNFEKIFGQQAARKNLDIKAPGWLPQTLALKSTFDVFLKNKVLEYCS